MLRFWKKLSFLWKLLLFSSLLKIVVDPLKKAVISLKKKNSLWPIGCICTKYSLLLSIVDQRLNHIAEDYGLMDDTQEGFRRHRSTKRQLGKLLVHSILAEQLRRKDSISVILYLDIKNAFNMINHRAFFHALEAKGFPPEDIALFKRMYTGSFLVMANRFGRSAACMLRQRVAQGALPSPWIFGLTFDQVHSVVRESRRGCTLQGTIEPTGSSGLSKRALCTLFNARTPMEISSAMNDVNQDQGAISGAVEASGSSNTP